MPLSIHELIFSCNNNFKIHVIWYAFLNIEHYTILLLLRNVMRLTFLLRPVEDGGDPVGVAAPAVLEPGTGVQAEGLRVGLDPAQECSGAGRRVADLRIIVVCLRTKN